MTAPGQMAGLLFAGDASPARGRRAMTMPAAVAELCAGGARERCDGRRRFSAVSRDKRPASHVRAGPTPLCPAGHLPLKGGDRRAARARPPRMSHPLKRCLSRVLFSHRDDSAVSIKEYPLLSPRTRLAPISRLQLISPLEGEMSGRTEGCMSQALTFPQPRVHASGAARIFPFSLVPQNRVSSRPARLAPIPRLQPISSIEGEMSGRTEGGMPQVSTFPQPRVNAPGAAWIFPFPLVPKNRVSSRPTRLAPRLRLQPISPLEGDMSGRTEGGMPQALTFPQPRVNASGAAWIFPFRLVPQNRVSSRPTRLAPRLRLQPISPLEGEMSGRTEGGRPQALTIESIPDTSHRGAR
ncbi:hypothetical protein J2Z17_001395 [Rhizobium halophytocola]|uniref:Uncharacterized protein n=1 Tax=Rhizobium halophytocola TaxID=735519 RepID=A0ABS4DWA4_9HYPH|nr:hypothetical protein [Rhizobium halophytocola]